MKLALAVTLLIGLSSVAKADEWTRSDSAFQAAGCALLLADYLQTKRIISDPVHPDHHEGNWVMRKHSGGLGLNPELYFLSVASSHAIAAVALPKRWRRGVQVALIAAQAISVGKNWHAGYSLTF